MEASTRRGVAYLSHTIVEGRAAIRLAVGSWRTTRADIDRDVAGPAGRLPGSMGRMKLYADTPGRRTLQIVADLLFVAWLVLWVWIGMAVHDGTLALAGPRGRPTPQPRRWPSSSVTRAARSVRHPSVGDELATPFDKAADASDGLAAAGRASVEAVEHLALVLGLSIALIPILIVCAIHLPRRWRFVREATAGAKFIDSADDLDLFALRALANQPMRVLAKVSDDPAGDWRARDPDVVRRLAELELGDVGLRPPSSPPRRFRRRALPPRRARRTT